MTPADAPSWRRVCALDELRAAGRLERLIGRRAALLLWRDGAPVACDAHCPHAHAPLVDGRVEDGRIHCARHMASFDLETGAPDGAWLIPPLRIYRLRVVDGWIELAEP